MVRALLSFGVTLLAASMSYAQNSTPTDQTEQVRLLLERIQQLERRVNDLEARQTSGSATAASTAAKESPVSWQSSQQQTPPAAIQPHEDEVREQAASVQQMEQHDPSLQTRGLGDVDFSATNQKGTNSGFTLGQLDLHLASALSRKITYFGEI